MRLIGPTIDFDANTGEAYERYEVYGTDIVIRKLSDNVVLIDNFGTTTMSARSVAEAKERILQVLWLVSKQQQSAAIGLHILQVIIADGLVLGVLVFSPVWLILPWVMATLSMVAIILQMQSTGMITIDYAGVAAAIYRGHDRVTSWLFNLWEAVSKRKRDHEDR